MGDNVLVSFDEERLMNDILDQGIDELKNSNPHTKSNSIINTNLSNPEHNTKKDLIANNKLANFNNKTNGSNEILFQSTYNAKENYGDDFERDANNFSSETISKIDQIKVYIKEGIENKSKAEINLKNTNCNTKEISNKSSNINSNIDYNQNKNLNAYGNNTKKNLAELKNNYNITDNSNLIINNENNRSTNTNHINHIHTISNIPNSYLGLKSPEAESNLILNDDTMQIMNNQTSKNNLLNSNNSNTNSREERQVAKSSALRALLDEMKTKNTFITESNENLNFNLKSNNLKTRTENLNSNMILGNDINNNYDDYSKTARTNNFVTNDFNDNNINYNNFNLANNINSNSTRVQNLSVDSANSNANDLNFDDMKNEIYNLQYKIDGLEKKLLDNTSSKESFDINFNTQTALEVKKRTSENLNTSKSSIKRSSKNKLNNNFHPTSPKNQTDSFTFKSKHLLTNFNSNNKISLDKHNYSSNTNNTQDLNYRKKYNSKNFKSKYAMLFDSECQNINTSQEFSPLADRSHYKSPFHGKNQNAETDKKTNHKAEERHDLSISSKNSTNSQKNFRTSLKSSKINDISNSNNINNNKHYERLNYSRGIYEENVLGKSKAKVNQSYLSDANNKTDEEGEELTSKRVADIIKKTQSILGRSASREFRSKSKDKPNAEVKSKINRVITSVLKTEKASAADLAADYSNCEIANESDANENYYNNYSDIERIIKPRGFDESRNFAYDKKSENKKRKKSVIKKSKSKLSKKNNDSNDIDNLQTFSNNNNNCNTNLIRCYDTASRVRSRKIKESTGKNASRISTLNRIINGSNRSFSINTYGNVKSKNNNEQKDKEKILKLKERNNDLKLSLKNARKKQEELEKKLKKIKFQEENFDCLEKNFIVLKKEFEKMQKNHNQSELIRKEQAKLIKSMKYEIELLKEGR